MRKIATAQGRKRSCEAAAFAPKATRRAGCLAPIPNLTVGSRSKNPGQKVFQLRLVRVNACGLPQSVSSFAVAPQLDQRLRVLHPCIGEARIEFNDSFEVWQRFLETPSGQQGL